MSWKLCKFIQQCPGGEVSQTQPGSSQWQPEPEGYPSYSQRLCVVRWSYILSRILEEGQGLRGFREKHGWWWMRSLSIFLMLWKFKLYSWNHECDWIFGCSQPKDWFLCALQEWNLLRCYSQMKGLRQRKPCRSKVGSYRNLGECVLLIMLWKRFQAQETEISELQKVSLDYNAFSSVWKVKILKSA